MYPGTRNAKGNKTKLQQSSDQNRKRKQKEQISQSPNKQRDAATTYDNQKESTHFLLSTI